MTILLVDDHPIVLQGICALLSSSFVDADILTAGCAEYIVNGKKVIR